LVALGKTERYGYNVRDGTMGDPEPSLHSVFLLACIVFGMVEGATTVRELGELDSSCSS